MRFDELILTLRARWRTVLLVWAAVVLAALVISVAVPYRYEASSILLVEPEGPDPLSLQGVYRPAGSLSTHMATQTEIMRSEEVALGALRLLGLDRDPEWVERWKSATGGQGNYEAWAAARLLRKLDVRPSRDSNVMAVGYTSSDPERAAATVNAFVRSYLEATLRIKVDPAKEFNSFFAERAKSLREALDEAKARLSAYEKKNGVPVGEHDVEAARLAELTSQLVALEDNVARAHNARKQAAASPQDMHEVRNDPEVVALAEELVLREGRLVELKSEFGERHHAVIQARRAVSDVNERLQAAMRRAAGRFGTDVKVSEARLAEARAAVERQRAVVLKRKAQRDAAAALQRDVENAQRAYDAVLTRASQTALESANRTQGTVSVLKNATPPVWSPLSLLINLSVAAVLGLLLGLCAAAGAEKRDRRVRSLADITERLQQPVLLLLPHGAKS